MRLVMAPLLLSITTTAAQLEDTAANATDTGSTRLCLVDGMHTARALRGLWEAGSGYDRDTRPGLAAALAVGNLSGRVDTIRGTIRIENLVDVDARAGELRAHLEGQDP